MRSDRAGTVHRLGWRWWSAMFLIVSLLPDAAATELSRGPTEAVNEFRRRIDEVLGKDLDPNRSVLLHRIVHAYPDEIRGITTSQESIVLKMADGSEAVFEDFKKKNYEDRIESPDVADTLHDHYPPTLTDKPWPPALDPGRYRNDAFLKAVYGSTQEAVRGHLETVDFLGKSVAFNGRNGAADALRRVAVELEQRRKEDPKRFGPYFEKMGGTFAWRTIAGTQRLSAHSYGISIDLNPDLGGYWRWEKEAGLSDMKRRQAYPQEIVAAFERHGFIWGGKWYHFDLMHFEYRPELLNDAGRTFPPPPSQAAGKTEPSSNPAPHPQTAASVEPTSEVLRYSIDAPDGKNRYLVIIQVSNPPQWVIKMQPRNAGTELEGAEVYRSETLAGLAVRKDLPKIPAAIRRDIEKRFLTEERARIAATGGSVEEFDATFIVEPMENAGEDEVRQFYGEMKRQLIEGNAPPSKGG